MWDVERNTSALTYLRTNSPGRKDTCLGPEAKSLEIETRGVWWEYNEILIIVNVNNVFDHLEYVEDWRLVNRFSTKIICHHVMLLVSI